MLKIESPTRIKEKSRQKKKYGMQCPYSKITMTTIRGRGRGTRGGKRIPTNIPSIEAWTIRMGTLKIRKSIMNSKKNAP